ncbi:MAG: hypothetical protein ABSE51_14970 [Terracidiphilus sp.]
MNRATVHAAKASAFFLCLAGLIGCVNSLSTPPAPPGASITGFAANPASITVGASTTLTGVFSNGTGVISPGDMTVATGKGLSVSPSATTTYTLTVIPASGATITQTTTVTVTPEVTPANPPGAPSALIATPGNAQVALTWTAGAQAVTYKVGRSTVSGGPYTVVGTASTATFIDKGLTNGTAYYYVAYDVNSAGTSAASSQAKAIPIAAPTNLTAVSGNQQVSLQWTASVGATSYNVYEAATSGGTATLRGTAQSPSYLDTGLTNGVIRWYQVVAVNSTGTSGPSAWVSATPTTTPPPPPPGAPSALSATPGNAQVSLTWTDGTQAVTYEVGRSAISGGPYTTVGTPSAATFTDTGLTNGTAYYYVVYAVSSTGTSAASNQAKAIPIAAPTNLTAVAGNQQVSLQWTASAGATSYNVYEAATSGGTATLQGTTQSSSYLDTGLTNGVIRWYQVVAVNSTGISAPSAWVSATPTTTTPPPPPPPPSNGSNNEIGLGTWFLNDWDGSSAFVDVFKHSRVWMNPAWTGPVTVDSLGWPTGDASTVLMSTTTPIVNGAYFLSFTGQATVQLMWSGGSVTNQVYNAATNTTTATVNIDFTTAAGSMGLIFTNTQRTAASAVGTGITNARLYRPGYATDGSQVFTTPFLNALSKVSTVRMMDWTNTNGNFVVNWADRVTPNSATQAGLPNIPYTDPAGTTHTNGLGGVALEYQIMLCNTLQVDCYINIPMVANDAFVNNMALAIAFGTDGTNPYTSTQTNPVFPPLNPNLHFYLEYANEVWNSAADVYGVLYNICNNLAATDPGNPMLTVDPQTNIYYTVWRYPAWRMATISQIFANVFGSSAMMTRVRPLLETQQGDGQSTIQQALLWLNDYAQTLSPPTTIPALLYGGGGSGYYGVLNSSNALPDDIFASGNYPDPQYANNWAVDSMWTYNYGIKHIAYEGGPSIEPPAPAVFTSAQYDTMNADPRIENMVETYHNAWSSQGGDLLIYYNLIGPPEWEFSPDLINNPTTPKLDALVALASMPKAAVTLGTTLPGILNAAPNGTDSPGIRNTSGYDIAIGNQTCTSGFNHPGDYIAYAANASLAITGTLVLNGSTSVATQIGVWINGVQQGTVTLAAQTTNTVEASNSMSVTIPAGFSMIRLQVITGGTAFCSLTVQ